MKLDKYIYSIGISFPDGASIISSFNSKEEAEQFLKDSEHEINFGVKKTSVVRYRKAPEIVTGIQQEIDDDGIPI